eukprot:680890_1
MLYVAKNHRNTTLLINAVSYWYEFNKCHRRATYWNHDTMRNLSLKSRMYNLIIYLYTKHKSTALEWWMRHHLKQRQLCDIKTKIETQRLRTDGYIRRIKNIKITQ